MGWASLKLQLFLWGVRNRPATEPVTLKVRNIKLSVKIEEGRLDLFSFLFIFIFIFDLFFYFLFLEQLGLGLIGHAVTSVTT